MRPLSLFPNVLLLLFIPLSTVQTQSTQQEVVLSNTRLHLLPAEAVSETYRIEVSLPRAYSDSSKSFAVLYLLDADKSFGMARDIVDWLSWAREIPQIIIVGVSYGGTTREWWDKRSRDYTPTRDTSCIWGSKWPLAGGADRFRTFLKTELFPFIEHTYRTLQNDRTIVGLSFGGLFADYVLIVEPALFSRYVILAPALAWGGKCIFRFEQAYYSSQRTLPAKVFTAVGSLDEKDIIEPWQQFNAVIASRKYRDLLWHDHTFPDETHISVFPGAFARGLKTVFAVE